MATDSPESPTFSQKAKKVHRSLENFDEYNIVPPLLTSPRSLEACRRQGIEPEELVFRSVGVFFASAMLQDPMGAPNIRVLCEGNRMKARSFYSLDQHMYQM